MDADEYRWNNVKAILNGKEIKMTSIEYEDTSSEIYRLAYDRMQSAYAKAKELILKNVISQIEGRPAVIEDAKNLTLGREEGNFDLEWIMYKDVVIGKLKYENNIFNFIPTHEKE